MSATQPDTSFEYHLLNLVESIGYLALEIV